MAKTNKENAMQLSELLSRLTMDQRMEFCEDLGRSYEYMRQIATGALKVFNGADKSTVRLAGADLCILVEDSTKKRDASSRSYPGVVFKHDLRPDYWPKPKKRVKG